MSIEISHAYDDIIGLPHHVSPTRKRMSLENRAAQFSPFAALTGYDAAVAEAGRWTDGRLELDETQIQRISDALRALRASLPDSPTVTLRYFIPDERKSGGAYRIVTGRVRRADSETGLLTLTDGTVIPFDDIYSLELEDEKPWQ